MALPGSGSGTTSLQFTRMNSLHGLLTPQQIKNII